MSKNKKKIIGLIIMGMLLTQVAPLAHAELLFTSEVFDNNSEIFLIDADNTGGDVTLQFGDILAETLTWDSANTQFSFSDDVSISGSLELIGAEDTVSITLTDTTNADSVNILTGVGDPDGVVTAESGSIYLDQDGNLFINRDGSTDWKKLLNAGGGASLYPATGIIDGLGLDSPGGGTTFSIAEGSYHILDNSDPADLVSTIVNVSSSDFVGVTVTDIATTDFTYLLLDASKTLTQQPSPPTVDQTRTQVYLGNLTHPNSATITDPATNLGWVAYNSTNDLNGRHFVEGTVITEGYDFDFDANGMTPDLSAGKIFRQGSNRLVNEEAPHSISSAGLVYGSSHLATYSNGSGGATIVGDASINPDLYDDGDGTPGAVGNQKYSRSFFYMFPVPSGNPLIFRQLGTDIYFSLDDARNDTDDSELTFLQEAAYVGELIMKKGTTDLDLAIAAGEALWLPSRRFDNLYRTSED